MKAKSEDIIFFTDSAASKPFGIPTMKELTEKVKDNLGNDELIIYNKIVNNLKGNGNSYIDIEGILSIVQYILDGDYQTNINDVLNFYINKNDRNTQGYNLYDKTKLNVLKLKLNDQIRQYCTSS